MYPFCVNTMREARPCLFHSRLKLFHVQAKQFAAFGEFHFENELKHNAKR